MSTYNLLNMVPNSLHLLIWNESGSTTSFVYVTMEDKYPKIRRITGYGEDRFSAMPEELYQKEVIQLAGYRAKPTPSTPMNSLCLVSDDGEKYYLRKFAGINSKLEVSAFVGCRDNRTTYKTKKWNHCLLLPADNKELVLFIEADYKTYATEKMTLGEWCKLKMKDMPHIDVVDEEIGDF